jgi:hypothetical protein
MSTSDDGTLDDDPNTPDPWDILGDLDKAICIIEVTRRSLEHQTIAGAEYAALGVVFQILLECHQRFDATASGLEPSSVALEVDQTRRRQETR